MEWDATPEYGFVTPNGHVIQGGLVTAILDSAMGGACWTVLNRDEVFLTADLRVEFFRPTRPGSAPGDGGRSCARSQRVVFCAAELFDSEELDAGGQPLHPGHPAVRGLRPVDSKGRPAHRLSPSVSRPPVAVWVMPVVRVLRTRLQLARLIACS